MKAIATLTTAIVLVACASQQDRSLLENAKSRAQALSTLRSQPGSLVRAISWRSKDRGIFYTYTRPTKIQIQNDSPFDVSDVTGRMMLIDSKGAPMAEVPFRAHGIVLAHHVSELPITATEITGDARHSETTIDSLHVINPD